MHVRFTAALTLTLLCVLTKEGGAQRASRPDYLFSPPAATLTFFGAATAPSAGSDLYTFSFKELTLAREDLRSGAHGLDLAIRLNPRWDAVLGVSFTRGAHRSEFREYVDQDNAAIEQTTSLRRVPVGASLRYHLTPRGEAIGTRVWIPARLVPWVGLGAGMMQYRFSQGGDFVDFTTFDIFPARYTAKGWAPFAQGSLGAGLSLSPHFELTGEARYVRSSGENGVDFEGFDRIDLSGVSTSIGLTVRF